MNQETQASHHRSGQIHGGQEPARVTTVHLTRARWRSLPPRGADRAEIARLFQEPLRGLIARAGRIQAVAHCDEGRTRYALYIFNKGGGAR